MRIFSTTKARSQIVSSCIHYSVFILVNSNYCHVYGVRVTKIAGSSSDDWIY
jgi:hypothetical protein